MQKYENNIKTINIKGASNGEIPLLLVNPDSQTSNLYIYVQGLGGLKEASLYFKTNNFYNNLLISYDKRNIGQNKAKPTKFKKKYLNELLDVISWSKASYKDKKIILLGESWGTALCLLAYKKRPDLIDDVIGWNMPYKIIDTCSRPISKKLLSGFKVLATIILNINTFEITFAKNEKKPLTNNKSLLRMQKSTTNNNKVSLAAWLSMRKAWKFMLKVAGLPYYKFLYIQSSNDALFDEKKWNKFSKLATDDQKLWIEAGYHVLSFDENCFDKVCDTILKRTKEDKNE